MRGLRTISLLVVCAAIAAACASDPETAKRKFMASGDSYAQQGKHREAVLEYRNAVTQDARWGEAYLKLGREYEQLREFGNALREYVRAADLLPDNVEAQLRAGKLLVASGQFPEGKARAAAVLAKDPTNVNGLIVMGNALAGLKDVDAAISQIEAAIDAQPALTFAYTNLGLLQSKKGDRDAAESAFKRAVEIAPKAVDPHVNLANFYWAVGRGAAAEQEFKIALGLDAKSVAANQFLAALYIWNGRRPEAEPYIKAYTDAVGSASSKLVLADYYLTGGRVKEAAAVLEPLRTQKEAAGMAVPRLAAIDFNAGRRPQAYEQIEQLLKSEPRNATALETKARFLLVEHKYQDALKTIDIVVNQNPKALRAMYVKGLALRNLGDVGNAIQAMQAVAQGSPAATPVQMQLAELYLLNGDAKTASDLVAGVVRREPRNGTAHFLYGQALLRMGNVQRAEAEIVPLANANPSVPDLQVWLGRVLMARNDRSRARQAFSKAMELQPESILALNGLVTLDIADKRFDAARERLKDRLSARPDDREVLFLAASAHSAMGDLAVAEPLFERVIEIDPANFDAYARLGQIYVSQNRLDEARQNYQQAAQKTPRRVAFATLLGMVLEVQKRPEEARKHYEEAIAIDPRAAVAGNNLAWMYAGRGENLDVALQLAQAAKSQLPDNAHVSDTLGWVYYQKGLPGLAVTAYKAAIAQDSRSAPIRYRLGLAYLKNGNKAEAARELEQALRLSPRFDGADDARRALAELKEVKG